MKFTPAVLTLAAAGSVAAEGHRHQHRHGHAKRDPLATQVVTVPGPTVVAYQLNGKSIEEAQACKGINDGTYVWADGKEHPGVCKSAPKEKPKEEPKEEPKPTQKAAQFYEQPASSAPPQAPTPSVEAPKPSKPASNPDDDGGNDDHDLSGGEGLDTDFPDGEVSCSTFPSKYGAIPVNYLGLDGYSGIQYITISGNAVSDIETAIKGGKGCKDGAMCSYACPPGYQKSQWPKIQGATGQSIGGLECKNGKLHLTNPSLSKKLCIKGTGATKVKNTMSSQVSVCRVDYPGSEGETIPLLVKGGETQPLTCPDASKYYVWQNKPTSAQYYVNNKGVGVEKACQWGDPSHPSGNFAPLNIGVGKRDGKTFISLLQNAPTTTAKLDFKIEIKGSNLGGECRYENGKYWDRNGSNDKGCTVEVISGTATYVFSD